jgi:hypothetical protein
MRQRDRDSEEAFFFTFFVEETKEKKFKIRCIFMDMDGHVDRASCPT